MKPHKSIWLKACPNSVAKRKQRYVKQEETQTEMKTLTSQESIKRL